MESELQNKIKCMSSSFTVNSVNNIITLLPPPSPSSPVGATDSSSKPRTASYKRQELSFAERIEVIAAHRATGKSMRQLALQFGCGKTQILNILNQSESIEREWEEKAAESNPHISNRKRRSRLTGNEETNRLVWQWYNTQTESGVRRITGPMIQREARAIARTLGINNFAASNGWLERFRHVHNIGPPQTRRKRSRRIDETASSAAATDSVSSESAEFLLDSIPIDQLFQPDPTNRTVNSAPSTAVASPQHQFDDVNSNTYVHDQRQELEAETIDCLSSLGTEEPAVSSSLSSVQRSYDLDAIDTRFHLDDPQHHQQHGRQFHHWWDYSISSSIQTEISNTTQQPEDDCDLRNLQYYDGNAMTMTVIQDDDGQQTSEPIRKNYNGESLIVAHQGIEDYSTNGESSSSYLPPVSLTQFVHCEGEDNRFTDQLSSLSRIHPSLLPFYQQHQQQQHDQLELNNHLDYDPIRAAANVVNDCGLIGFIPPADVVVDSSSSSSFQHDRHKMGAQNNDDGVDNKEEDNYRMYSTTVAQQGQHSQQLIFMLDSETAAVEAEANTMPTAAALLCDDGITGEESMEPLLAPSSWSATNQATPFNRVIQRVIQK